MLRVSNPALPGTGWRHLRVGRVGERHRRAGKPQAPARPQRHGARQAREAAHHVPARGHPGRPQYVQCLHNVDALSVVVLQASATFACCAALLRALAAAAAMGQRLARTGRQAPVLHAAAELAGAA